MLAVPASRYQPVDERRTGHEPAVRATLRNLATSVHRRHDAIDIATATGRTSRHPSGVLPLLL